MPTKVTIQDLINAVPVLKEISGAKLPAFGAIKVAQIIEFVDATVKEAEQRRLNKLIELSEKDDNGKRKTTERTLEDGRVVQVAVFKSITDEANFEAYWDGVTREEVMLPMVLKTKYFEPAPNKPGSGHLLTPAECIQLGKLLYRGEFVEDKDEEEQG